MIKEATWWGNNYILSGSDCGHIFGWERATGRLILLLEADRHVVNCVQPHPLDPILASSGIDYNVKLWAPMKPEIDFDHDAADLVCSLNKIIQINLNADSSLCKKKNFSKSDKKFFLQFLSLHR